MAGLVRALKRQSLMVYVVDDNSTDNTLAAAFSVSARCYSMPPPRAGIGPSLRLGVSKALEAGAKSILIIDAGGSHDPEEAHRLLDGLHDYDVVVGSRFRAGAAYVRSGFRTRPLLSRLMTRFLNFGVGRAVTSDWTSGYRAYRRDAMSAVNNSDFYRCMMHGYQIEALGLAVANRLRVGEVPITYRAGQSSFNTAIGIEAMTAACRTISLISRTKT